MVSLLLLSATSVHATKPRAIDCEKARSVQRGWTSKQAKKALGKPYSMEFSRNAMAYGWKSPDGKEYIRVAFDAAHRDVDERKAVVVLGECGGSPLVAGDSLDPRLGEIPRRILSGGTTFHLAYVGDSRERKTRFVEYVPENQSLIGWRQMISVYHHVDGSTPSAHLQTAREIAQRTGNPHFQQVYVSLDGAETIAALPMLRDDSVEYQVARWTPVSGGVMATVYLTRSYNRDGVDRNVYVASEKARTEESVARLRALPAVTPPDLGKSDALTLTRNGTEDSPVLTLSPR